MIKTAANGLKEFWFAQHIVKREAQIQKAFLPGSTTRRPSGLLLIGRADVSHDLEGILG